MTVTAILVPELGTSNLSFSANKHQVDSPASNRGISHLSIVDASKIVPLAAVGKNGTDVDDFLDELVQNDLVSIDQVNKQSSSMYEEMRSGKLDLLALRLRSGLKQKDVDFPGGQANLSRIENGLADPNAASMDFLAVAYNVSIGEIAEAWKLGKRPSANQV
jgi:hypothetical protein